MSNLQYYAYPGLGMTQREKYGYEQAVRVGDRIECSGQGGLNITTGEIVQDHMAQIDQAFAVVDHTLKDAGGKGWPQVFRVNSYHTEFTDEVLARMVQNFRKWMPDHRPIWTAVGVASLALPGMRVEIEVSAFDEEGAAEARKGRAVAAEEKK